MVQAITLIVTHKHIQKYGEHSPHRMPHLATIQMPHLATI